MVRHFVLCAGVACTDLCVAALMSDRVISYIVEQERWTTYAISVSPSFRSRITCSMGSRSSVLFSWSVCGAHRLEARRYDRCPRGEQRDEYVGGIERTLVGGAEHTGEHLLTGANSAGKTSCCRRRWPMR